MNAEYDAIKPRGPGRPKQTKTSLIVMGGQIECTDIEFIHLQDYENHNYEDLRELDTVILRNKSHHGYVKLYQMDDELAEFTAATGCDQRYIASLLRKTMMDLSV